MTERQDRGRPPQYPQPYHGPDQRLDYHQNQHPDHGLYPPDQPRLPQPRPHDNPPDPSWRPRPYDPVVHMQRISGPQPSRPAPDQPWPQPDYWQHPYPWSIQDSQPPGWGQPAYPSRPDAPRPSEPAPYAPSAPSAPPVPPGRRGGPSWGARHKVLTGLIALVVLVAIGGIVKLAGDTRKPTADLMTAANAPSCLVQLSSWIAGGGKKRTSVLSGDLSALGKASGKLSASKSPAAIAAVRSAARSVQSGVTAVKADAGPSCVPGLRRNLLAAARDYAQAAADATSGMSQLTNGNDAKAATDASAASAASKRGNAKLTAATKAATAFSAG